MGSQAHIPRLRKTEKLDGISYKTQFSYIFSVLLFFKCEEYLFYHYSWQLVLGTSPPNRDTSN